MSNLSTQKNIAKGKFLVTMDQGLHATPSIEIVKCATSFKSQIYLVYQKQIISAKSLLSILSLTATKGAKIAIKALGEDAEEAVQSLLALAKNKI